MASRPKGRVQEQQISEAEYHRDISAAVANTEAEIMAEALGDEEPEDDADTSLEQMTDGLGEDELETDADDEEAPQQGQQKQPQREAKPQGEAEDEEEPEDEPEEGETEGEEAQPDDRRGFIPPPVLREQRQRARAAEERAERVERELAELRGQMAAMQNMQPRRQQEEQQPDPEPDMIVEPARWREWYDRQTDQRVERLVQQRMGSFRQEQQERDSTRINTAFNELANGPRGFEFNAAYQALIAQDPRDPRARSVVQRIYNSADPGAALYDWWEDNGAEDFRANVAEQLGMEYQREDQDEAPRRGNPPQRQARQVYRQPVSLNSARGGGNRSQNDRDPRSFDDSESSVFDYATSRNPG
jgi:hypothetical protein